MRIAETGLTDIVALARAEDRAPAFVARVDAGAWLRVAQAARAAHHRLVTLWGTGHDDGTREACAAYAFDDGLLWLKLPVPTGGTYPALSPWFASATRMQRAVAELVGLHAADADDTRAWLNHGHWPADYHPLAPDATGRERFAPQREHDYPFVPVSGDGVHEIAVGPIHAGVIEPGHFRFSVVGEKVLRLEERLGYTHRGIERLFAGRPLAHGHTLAARIAGDSAVAFATAYCSAAEQALGMTIPVRAQWLRALLLERERVANHLGDLGALGNDAGFAFGLAQFARLKEDWLRTHAAAFGHRYLMDCVVPGGVAADPTAAALDTIHAECERIEHEVRTLQRIYDEQSGLQDRFARTGVLSADVVEHFGVAGLAARASGIAADLRVDHPGAPYDTLGVALATDTRGDVAARVAVRFAETYESLRLIAAIAQRLLHDPGPHAAALPSAREAAHGAGWIEGWRGPVLVALDTAADGTIARCHCHDPSWHAWPALEHAIIGNIVADFPLINKSFNLNYAGHDL